MKPQSTRTKLTAMAIALVALAAISTVWGGSRKRAIDMHGPENHVLQRLHPELGTYLSNEDMAAQAEIIAIGRCTETRSQWFGRNLLTMATVSVSEVIKGDQQSSVTVALPGGVDAKRKFPIAMTYVGAPTMQPDEEVFLFLTGKDQVPEAYTVVGYSQGKFTITEDEDGQKMISRDLSSPSLNKRGKIIKGEPKTIPLSDFKSQIEDYLQR